MKVMPVNITDKQEKILFKRRQDTKIPVAAQIREAIDLYIKENNLEGDQ